MLTAKISTLSLTPATASAVRGEELQVRVCLDGRPLVDESGAAAATAWRPLVAKIGMKDALSTQFRFAAQLRCPAEGELVFEVMASQSAPRLIGRCGGPVPEVSATAPNPLKVTAAAEVIGTLVVRTSHEVAAADAAAAEPAAGATATAGATAAGAAPAARGRLAAQ